MQFKIIVCGLDSIEARRWINSTLVGMVDPENPESLKPLIDGGTEGMLMVRIIQLLLSTNDEQVSKDKLASFFHHSHRALNANSICTPPELLFHYAQSPPFPDNRSTVSNGPIKLLGRKSGKTNHSTATTSTTSPGSINTPWSARSNSLFPELPFN